MKELRGKLNESLKKIREAPDKEAKEKAYEEMRSISNDIYALIDEVKKKTNGKTPENCGKGIIFRPAISSPLPSNSISSIFCFSSRLLWPNCSNKCRGYRLSNFNVGVNVIPGNQSAVYCSATGKPHRIGNNYYTIPDESPASSKSPSTSKIPDPVA